MSEMQGFAKFVFEGPLSDEDRTSHSVYVKGQGRPLVLLQEMPGIGPTTLKLIDRLNEAGFRVYLPHMFGPLGRQSFAGNIVRLFCMRRAFHMFARKQASPITNWIAALCREAQQRENGERVGVIGMCLTGGFALTLMADDSVLGGVASQPSLPVFAQSSLHMSSDDISAARVGMAAKGGAIAMRYAGDPLCKAAKMDAITEAFGEGVVTHTFAGRGHALLTDHFSNEAFETMIQYFDARYETALTE